MYLNFNIFNNEVFEMGIDDKLLEVAKRAVVRNRELAAEGEQPCVGTIWVPDDFWKWEIAERSAFLEWVKEMGIDVLIGNNGWKIKKRKDRTWERREYKIDSGV